MFSLVIAQTPSPPPVKKGSRALGEKEFSHSSIAPLTLNGLKEKRA